MNAKTQNQIKEFNRENLRVLRARMSEALAPVAEEFGLSMELGRMGYQSSNFSVKVEVSTKGENGEVYNKDAEAFGICSKWVGIKAEALGETFNSGDSTYTLTGWKPRSPKYPVLATEVSTGKTFKFTAESVVRALRLGGKESLLSPEADL